MTDMIIMDEPRLGQSPKERAKEVGDSLWELSNYWLMNDGSLEIAEARQIEKKLEGFSTSEILDGVRDYYTALIAWERLMKRELTPQDLPDLAKFFAWPPVSTRNDRGVSGEFGIVVRRLAKDADLVDKEKIVNNLKIGVVNLVWNIEDSVVATPQIYKGLDITLGMWTRDVGELLAAIVTLDRSQSAWLMEEFGEAQAIGSEFSAMVSRIAQRSEEGVPADELFSERDVPKHFTLGSLPVQDGEGKTIKYHKIKIADWLTMTYDQSKGEGLEGEEDVFSRFEQMFPGAGVSQITEGVSDYETAYAAWSVIKRLRVSSDDLSSLSAFWAMNGVTGVRGQEVRKPLIRVIQGLAREFSGTQKEQVIASLEEGARKMSKVLIKKVDSEAFFDSSFAETYRSEVVDLFHALTSILILDRRHEDVIQTIVDDFGPRLGDEFSRMAQVLLERARDGVSVGKLFSAADLPEWIHPAVVANDGQLALVKYVSYDSKETQENDEPRDEWLREWWEGDIQMKVWIAMTRRDFYRGDQLLLSVLPGEIYADLNFMPHGFSDAPLKLAAEFLLSGLRSMDKLVTRIYHPEQESDASEKLPYIRHFIGYTNEIMAKAAGKMGFKLGDDLAYGGKVVVASVADIKAVVGRVGEIKSGGKGAFPLESMVDRAQRLAKKVEQRRQRKLGEASSPKG